MLQIIVSVGLTGLAPHVTANLAHHLPYGILNIFVDVDEWLFALADTRRFIDSVAGWTGNLKKRINGFDDLSSYEWFLTYGSQCLAS